jgi:predicted RND superfamily exporter protein
LSPREGGFLQEVKLGDIAKAIHRHPGIAIFAVLIVTALALIPVSNFKIDSTVEGFFTSDDPDVKMAEEVRDRFGSQDLITVVVDCSYSDTSVGQAYVESLGQKLEDDARWKNIQYRYDLSFAGGKAILYLPQENLEMLTAPDIPLEVLQDSYTSLIEEANSPQYIVSENGEIFLINAGVNVDMEDSSARDAVLDDLGELIDETREESTEYESLEVGFTGGMAVIDYEGDKMVRRDFFVTGGVTLILILILLFVSFRSLSLPLLSAVPLVVGVIWTTGLVFLIYDSLHILSAMFAALIFGIGIDYCIHLLMRFTDEMDKHDDAEVALHNTFAHTGKAIIIGCVTTAAAFFAFYFADTKGLHQLGVVGASGLLLTLVAVFVLLPALLTLWLKFRKPRPSRGRFDMFRRVGSQVNRIAPVFIMVMIALFVLFGVRATQAELSQDIYELLPTDTETYKQLDKVKDNFGYNPDRLTCVVDSDAELADRVEAFQQVEGVTEVDSILTYLPEDQDEKLEIIQQAIEVNPEIANIALVNVSPMTWGELPEDIQRPWVSEEEEFLIAMTPDGNLYDKSYQAELLSTTREIDPNVTAEAVMWIKALDMVAADMIRTSLFASGVLFLIVYVGIRRWNPVYALLSLIPVTFGIVGLLGTYDWFGATLSAFSIAMIPLVIGIGIDDGIHIIHRYLEEGRGSIPVVIHLTGKAIFLTTATTCLAFSSFLFSSHPSLNAVALIPIIGLIICLFGAVLLMPALLKMIVDR